jgi:hypothetical protein
MFNDVAISDVMFIIYVGFIRWFLVAVRVVRFGWFWWFVCCEVISFIVVISSIEYVFN